MKKKDYSSLLGESLWGDCKEAVLCRSGLSDIAEGAQVCRHFVRRKQLQTRHITQKPGFRAFKIDMFDVKHARLLCCGCDNQLSSGVRFVGLRS